MLEILEINCGTGVGGGGEKIHPRPLSLFPLLEDGRASHRGDASVTHCFLELLQDVLTRSTPVRTDSPIGAALAPLALASMQT